MTKFDPRAPLIVVHADLFGPSGRILAHLALDTGATETTIHPGLLLAIGCDPALSPDRLQVTTASGVEFAPRVALSRISALGIERSAFPVLALTLPPSATVDGLLGLDFLRERRLTIDFQAGTLVLE